MHQVHLTDENYEKAKVRAVEAGFRTVDDFINRIIGLELSDDPEDLDHLFTPEILAELDRVTSEIDAGGKTYSEEEVSQHLKAFKKEWRSKRAG